MIQELVIASLLAAGASAVGTWKVQNWRYAAMEEERTAKVREDNRLNQIKERADSAKVIGALNAAKLKEQAARDAAANAGAERDSLHDDLARLRSGLPGLSLAACQERASTLSEVFEQCTDRYIGMAAKAQRHSDDTDTLEAGWPK